MICFCTSVGLTVLLLIDNVVDSTWPCLHTVQYCNAIDYIKSCIWELDNVE